jgi:hypothetical protein
MYDEEQIPGEEYKGNLRFLGYFLLRFLRL